MPGQTPAQPHGAHPRGTRVSQRALCSRELPAAENHCHFFKPWGWNEAALTWCTKPQPVAHRKIRHCWGLFCAPFWHKDDFWWLTGDTSPGTPGVSSPLCISMKLNSVSDSASPLCQRCLCHPQGTHLPPYWHNLPASFGTGSPARCAQALQNPLCPKAPCLGHQQPPSLLSAGPQLQLCPQEPPSAQEKGEERAGPAKVLNPSNEEALSTLQPPSARATSGPHALILPPTQSYQDGKQPQNVVVLCFCAPATECCMKWENYI